MPAALNDKILKNEAKYPAAIVRGFAAVVVCRGVVANWFVVYVQVKGSSKKYNEY